MTAATPLQSPGPTRTSAPGRAASAWLIRLPEMRFISLTTTGDGGALLLGEVMTQEPRDISDILIRLDSGGGVRWSKLLKPGYHAALEVEDGGILLFSQFGLVRLDPAGNFSGYEKTEDASGGNYFLLPRIQSVIRKENGQRLVLGNSSSTSFSPTGVVTDHHEIRAQRGEDTLSTWLDEEAHWSAGRIDYSGFWVARSGLDGLSWQRRFNFDKFGSDTHAVGQQVLGTRDGGGFFAAAIRYLRSMAPHVGIWAVRLNSSGGIRWQIALDGGIEENLQAIETHEGGFLLVSASGYMADQPSSQLRLVLLNAQGNQVWDRWYGDGTQSIAPLKIIQLPDGGFLAAAIISPADEDTIYQKILLLRTDPDGLVQNCSWLNPSPLDLPIAKAPDSELTGWSGAERAGNQAATTRLPEVTIDLSQLIVSAEYLCR